MVDKLARDRIARDIIASAAEALGYETEGGAIRHERRTSVGITTAILAVSNALDAQVMSARATPSQRLDAATVERCDCIDLEALTYDELWQAIADATRVKAGAVGISVVKFRDAVRALATEPHQHGAGNGEKHGG